MGGFLAQVSLVVGPQTATREVRKVKLEAMARPSLALIVLSALTTTLVIGGCHDRVPPNRQRRPVTHAPASNNSKKLYAYLGQGSRLMFKEHPKAKIAWIEAGPARWTAHGESLSGGGGTIENLQPARIGFASGAVLTFKSVTLERSLEGVLYSASAPDPPLSNADKVYIETGTRPGDQGATR